MANYPPLQLIGAAVYGRLSGDATLTGLASGSGIVNDEPAEPTYPFVVVPAATATPWNTLGGTYGWHCEITPTVYSRYEGDLQALQIGERIIALLNDYALTITGYTTVICEVDPDASPIPVKVTTEYPNKVERRLLAIRFRILVHE